MFIPFPAMSSLLSLLSVFAFRRAGSGVWALSGPIVPRSSSLVSTITCFGGNHSPALQGCLRGMCRRLEHCWRWNGRRWEIWRINTGSKNTLTTDINNWGLSNYTRQRNKNLCTLETLVCIICHSVVSHLQGDTQTQLQCVYIHSELYTWLSRTETPPYRQ